MKMTRRAFVKANAAASAAAVAGITLPASATNLIASSDQTAIHWDKAPCRFVVQAVLCWSEPKMVALSPHKVILKPSKQRPELH